VVRDLLAAVKEMRMTHIDSYNKKGVGIIQIGGSMAKDKYVLR